MKSSRFNWSSALLLLFACVLLTTGCNQVLHGTWKCEKTPEEEAFFIKTATFKDDNTCTAIAQKGDETVKLAGTYEFNGLHLTIKQPGKPNREYDAKVWFGTRLDLKSKGKSQTLNKQ